ncbi:hypothetical protein RKD54_002879 [Pseudarthrobacter sp. SLBN-100]
MRSSTSSAPSSARRVDVVHVRCVVGKDSLDPVHTAHGHSNVRMAGQRHRRQPVDLRALDPVRRFAALRGRCNDQDVVAPVLQVVQHPQDGLRDAVHQGQE